MSGETQPRRRKDKKKKDSASDEGTGDEELKEHPASEGGSSCLTVLVFLVLLAGVGVLLGLIYVQSQGIAHVDTPAPPPAAAPLKQTIVETITEGGETPPAAADQSDGAPAGQPEGSGDAPVEVVEQVIEEHIVYVDAPPDGEQPEQQEQVVYVDSPQPVGIQLEGSEPRLEEQLGGAASPPPQAGAPAPVEHQVVQEEKMVRMRQVVKQITEADGTVREEIVSEEVVEDDYEEPAAEQTTEPEQQQQPEAASEPEKQPDSEPVQEEEAPVELDEGVDVTEDSAPPSEQQQEVVQEAPVEVEEAVPVTEAVVTEKLPVQVSEEEVPPQEEVPESVEDVTPQEDTAPHEDSAPLEASEVEVEELPLQEEVSEPVVEEDAAPQEEDTVPVEDAAPEVISAPGVEDEPQQQEEEKVATGAAPPAPASVPPTDSVPVDTNTQDRPAATQQKQAEAGKVEEKPKEAVKDDKPKEPVKEETPKEPVKKEKLKESVKEEKPKEPVKDETPRKPVKEEKPKEPVKEETPKKPVKEDKPKEPVTEKPKEPAKEDAKKLVKEEVKEPVKKQTKETVKHEKVKEVVKEEKAKEPESKEKDKKPVKEEKTKEPVKDEKPAKQGEPKPTEAPVKKEVPTDKPKEVVPTEKPVVKEVPTTEKPAPKTSAKEAEEIERVRSGQKEPKKPADTASKPATGQKEQPARPDTPVERDTDKHAKQTAKPAVDEGIVADIDDPSDASEYHKADVTGPEDWDIREELDAADNMVDTDDQAALSAFAALLARHPRSPRALWGRARALNAQAMRERSNNALDKAIRAFRDVLDLDLEPETPVKPELYRRAAETCVQQMRFRGDLEQAARIQQRMIQKFPDDYLLRNHLATVFMTYGQNGPAEEVLNEVLRRWPDNGYAKVHLGFIRRQEGKHEVAVELMQAGLDSDEPGVHHARFYYHLGDSYDRVGRRDLAVKTYEEGVKRGLLLSVLQRSLVNVDRLTGRPYWTAGQSGSQELVRALESNFTTIRGEMLALLDSDRPEDGFQPELEQLSKTGDWRQYTLFRRGRRSQYACVKTPRTCEIIDKFPEAAGCRRGQVKFSMLAPGTTVWPHTGPTNCRLRLHLGLKVPTGTGIRVAGEKRTWEEGKVLIFDDSFEHDVWNEGTAARFVLIVDIWHPELTEEERRTLPAI